MSVLKIQFVALVAATSILCHGCKPGTGPMGRTTVPNGSLEVELSEPISHFELFDRMNSIAFESGFKSQRGSLALDSNYVETAPTNVRPDPTQHNFSWHPTDESTYTDSDYHIRVFWEEHGPTTDSFTFIFFQGGLATFQSTEWILFYRWKDVLIPSVFPEMAISTTISTHPVVFTDCDDMELVSRETGIPIPDNVDWCDDQSE